MDWHTIEDMDTTDIDTYDTDVDHYDEYYTDGYTDEPINVVTACILPSLTDTLGGLIVPVFASTLVLQLISTISILRKISTGTSGKILTAVTGITILWYHFRENSQLFSLTVMAYFSASVAFIKLKVSPWYYCGLIIFFNELYTLQEQRGTRIRMHLMILLMKIVSYEDACLKESSSKRVPSKTINTRSDHHNLLDLLTYLFNPSSILLNSWHVYEKFQSKPLTSHSIKSLLHIVCSLIKSLTFLIISMCLIPVVIEDYVDRIIATALFSSLPSSVAIALYKLLIAYLMALQFRCSHYFICYLTEASFKLSHIEGDICHFSEVEFPRSLVQVVIAWNIPMHNWLKRHVFFKLKEKYNILVTIVGTYLISSSIHGFNFQIWSVLLSLGVLTFIEERLRFKLSRLLDACVQSRRCARNNIKCSSNHRNGSGLIVWSTNALFTLLSIAHLAYLGASFDGQETSSSANHVIQVWFDLSFYSHVIALITFAVYLIL